MNQSAVMTKLAELGYTLLTIGQVNLTRLQLTAFFSRWGYSDKRLVLAEAVSNRKKCST